PQLLAGAGDLDLDLRRVVAGLLDRELRRRVRRQRGDRQRRGAERLAVDLHARAARLRVEQDRRGARLQLERDLRAALLRLEDGRLGLVAVEPGDDGVGAADVELAHERAVDRRALVAALDLDRRALGDRRERDRRALLLRKQPRIGDE